MHVLKWSFADRIVRSPDDPAVDPAAADPSAVAALAAEPAALDPAPEPAADPTPAADPAPQPAPAPRAEPKMVPLRVLQERVGEETTKRQAAEQRAQQAEERNRSFEEIVARLRSQQPAADPAVQPTPRAAEPAATVTEDAVRAEAQRQILERDLGEVSQTGLAKYGQDWVNAINALNSYGANSIDFVARVMDIDKSRTHEIMFDIAQDPERAVQLAKMTPTRQIAEITRMIMAKEAPAQDPKPAAEPKPAISRAPAPAPRMAPAVASAPEVDPTTPEGNDKLDDKAWEAWYKKTYLKRA